VYLNEKVLAIQSLYYDSLKEKLKTKIEGLKNGKDICDFIKEIYNKLKKDIENIKKEVKNRSKHVPIMRFEFEGDDLNEQLKEKEKLDKHSLKAKLEGSSLVEVVNSNCYRVVWKTPLNFYVIQYNSKSDRRSLITVFRESFDTVRKFLEEIKDKYTFNETKKFLEDLEDLRNNCSEAYRDRIERLVEHIKNKYGEASYIEHKRDVIEKIAKKYIEQALKLFFNNEDIRWEWKHTSFLRSYFNFPDAVMGFTDDVYGFYKENIISKFNKKHNETSESHGKKMESIEKELEAKLKVVEILNDGEESIKGKPDILCITISNLIAYSVHSGNQLMEVDGLILGLTTEKQLFICLIEAKSRNENAVKNLKSKICARIQDILEVYDISKISNLINSVKDSKDNEKDPSIAYLIITDEKIPTT
jgi:protein-arginine kinase activator protein McsA